MELSLSNLALHHLIEENQIVVNGFINKIQTTPQGFLKLKIHTKNGDKTLLVAKNTIFVTKTGINAKQSPGGFSEFIKKYIFNQRVICLKQKEFDRIVLMEFNDVFLIFELFSKGNIILCDKNFKIIRAMKKEKWKDRELKTAEIYKFPSSKGKNPLKIENTEFFNLLKENKKTLFGAIVDIINIAPKILDFLFEKNEWDKTCGANKIDQKQANLILKEIQDFYSKKPEGAFIVDNIIYSVNIDLSAKKEFKTITELLNEKIFFSEDITTKIEEKKSKNRKEDYSKQIEQAIIEEKQFLEAGEKIYLEYNKLNEIILKINELKKQKNLNKEIENEIKNVYPIVKEINIEKNKLLIEI